MDTSDKMVVSDETWEKWMKEDDETSYESGGVGGEIQEEYDTFVYTSCVHKDPTYPFLGLVGECGEVLEHVKKAWRSYEADWLQDEDRQEKIFDELSDVLWYLTRCTQVMGGSLEDLMRWNMMKLKERQKNGD